MKITALKKNTIPAIAGICVLLVAVFWVFVCIPTAKRAASLKKEINALKNEISGIESRGGEKGRDIKQMVDSIHRDYNAALQRLPSKEEDVLKFMSSEANRNRLDIVNITPGPKKPMLDENGAAVTLEDRQCAEMSVSMGMRGLYKSIRDYLRVLCEESPFLIRVEDINIRKDPAIAPRLSAKLELVICLAP